MRWQTSTGEGWTASSRSRNGGAPVCSGPDDPTCRGGPDVMGYHDQREIPNYWAYARHYVLQDHMFHPTRRGACPHISSWSPAGRPRAHGPEIPRAARTTTISKPRVRPRTTTGPT